eukprot:CAMPEP_0174830280 /NCGR_PEP_ID=MMETSP1114-20130205/2434_1 /TAXON_ID=312471 /ORGANISM="Neobodo designis, Strain CCAP 1951/1" /LENGTH=229 /DNA_ID=CAMNT_0016064071 /DNA_START=29 /DNA_END=718 /DNA_ORIENTATION=+
MTKSSVTAPDGLRSPSARDCPSMCFPGRDAELLLHCAQPTVATVCAEANRWAPQVIPDGGRFIVDGAHTEYVFSVDGVHYFLGALILSMIATGVAFVICVAVTQSVENWALVTVFGSFGLCILLWTPLLSRTRIRVEAVSPTASPADRYVIVDWYVLYCVPTCRKRLELLTGDLTRVSEKYYENAHLWNRRVRVHVADAAMSKLETIDVLLGDNTDGNVAAQWRSFLGH